MSDESPSTPTPRANEPESTPAPTPASTPATDQPLTYEPNLRAAMNAPPPQVVLPIHLPAPSRAPRQARRTNLPRITRRTIMRYVIDHNPFYLLSAVCMLAGCIALTNSTSWTSIRLTRLLALIFTLNVYELLMVGWAIYLIRRRNLLRDGVILLMLEAFFLVDVTFLNAEVFAANLIVGTIVNLIVLTLAVVKVSAVFRGLGVSLMDGAFSLVLIELAMLFTLPGVFKQISTAGGGGLPAGAVYAAWWTIGLVPVLGTVLLRDGRNESSPSGVAFRRARHLIGALMILPVVSLIAHVSTSNWVYNVRWYPANVTPLLLGLAIAVGSYDRHVKSLAARMRAQLMLPQLGLLLSIGFPSALVFTTAGVTFSPLRLTLLAMALVYAHGFWMYRHAYFAWGALVSLGTAGLGWSMQSIADNIEMAYQQVMALLRRLLPRTSTHWGVMAIAASFVLLVMGAMVSMLKDAPAPAEDAPPGKASV
jgi:hypothetical protein